MYGTSMSITSTFMVAYHAHRHTVQANMPPGFLLCVQLQHGFTASDNSLHTDLLTDRLATENYQRFRSATVLLFLGDEPSSEAAGGLGSSSRNWSVVFPLARGGAWRGSAVPFEYKAIMEQGKQVHKSDQQQHFKPSNSPRCDRDTSTYYSCTAAPIMSLRNPTCL